MLIQIKRLILIGLLFGLAVPATALGQQTQDDLAAQIEELKKGQEQIRQQLQQIQTLLQQRQAPARPAGPNVAGKTFDLGDNPVKGASSARLTLVEFTDYQ
jgi:protein-disulfide isomerase